VSVHFYILFRFLIHSVIKINILIDEDGNARITDFGLITITESQAFETDFTAHTGRGSVRWMAPELFGSEVRINRSTDVYAFGMTIHEVLPSRVSPSSSDATNLSDIYQFSTLCGVP
jgi:serine/threonine protein kinase